ncbi:MAG: AmmeMemoRadiSam system protein B [candidate division Zixibacteria bacterium]|nr:AmmeMemoRadiSam system protein B [candidate division Zixibacteria bacterium]
MAEQTEIRKPAVAGMFYPGEPGELVKQLAQYYSEAKKKALPGHPVGIIAPHAGYMYSGRTAAEAYKQLEGEQYDVVVVISPSHTVFFQGVSVYNGSAYETPLGTIEIEAELSRKIAQIHPGVFLSNKGHTGGSVRGEHALEVQLPFLQQVLGKFKLVALVMGDQEESTARSLGEVLASALSGKSCLIVASTDLSHFYPDKEARRLDGNIRNAVEQYNPDRLRSVLGSGKGEACGGGPMIAMMIATKRMGGEQVVITRYTTSAESSGDFNEVVGYLSAVVVSSKKPKSADVTMGAMPKKASDRLVKAEKQYLLDLAKRSIAAGLQKTKLDEPEPESRLLKEHRGAFVTIKINGSLRGCIGMIRAALPLYQAVADMAQAAAFDDPRFAELSDREFEKLEIEISVLSPLMRVKDFEEIKVGRDGLVIRMDMHSGLLLPQVASEYNWDRTTFLEQTCLKAGLPKNSYKEKNAEVYRFTADVF